MFNKFISPIIFIISLALGLFFVYLSNPIPTTIFVYPTPDNIDKFQYKDKVSNCFEFDSHQITCPKNSKEVKVIPFQK
jgi:hypothetical protein